MPDSIANPENYRELAKPFENSETATAALSGFWDELYELRNKWRLRDVHVIVSVGVEYESEEGDVMAALHCGDAMKAEAMAAFALGNAQAKRQEMIGTTIRRAAKAAVLNTGNK